MRYSFPFLQLLFQFSLLHFQLLYCCSLEDDELEHLTQVKEMFVDVDSSLSHLKEKKYLAKYCGCVVKEDLSDFCMKIMKQYDSQEKGDLMSVLSEKDKDPKVQFILDVSHLLEPTSIFLLPQKSIQATLKLIKHLSTYNMSSILPENGFPFDSGVNREVYECL